MRVQVSSLDERELRRRLAALGSNRGSKIAAGALNDAAKTAKKVIAREIAKTYKVSSKEVKEALDVTKANASRPRAVIKTNRKGAYKLAAYDHGITPKKPWNPAMSIKPRRKKYKIKFRKSGSAKEFLHGFVAEMDSGHVGFFVIADDSTHKINPKATGVSPRVRNKRTELGIKEVYTHAIAQLAGKERVLDQTVSESQESLQKSLEKRINNALRGRGV